MKLSNVKLDPKTTLERLKTQEKKLKYRIQKLKAHQKHWDRKKEKQQKMLIGTYYWEQALKNGHLATLKQEMRDVLTRESDKALFLEDPSEG